MQNSTTKAQYYNNLIVQHVIQTKNGVMTNFNFKKYRTCKNIIVGIPAHAFVRTESN